MIMDHLREVHRNAKGSLYVKLPQGQINGFQKIVAFRLVGLAVNNCIKLIGGKCHLTPSYCETLHLPSAVRDRLRNQW